MEHCLQLLLLLSVRHRQVFCRHELEDLQKGQLFEGDMGHLHRNVARVVDDDEAEHARDVRRLQPAKNIVFLVTASALKRNDVFCSP